MAWTGYLDSVCCHVSTCCCGCNLKIGSRLIAIIYGIVYILYIAICASFVSDYTIYIGPIIIGSIGLTVCIALLVGVQ